MSEAPPRIPYGEFYMSLTPAERCRWYQWADIEGGMDERGLFPELVERFVATLVVQRELF